jgi:hypothetical protein
MIPRVGHDISLSDIWEQIRTRTAGPAVPTNDPPLPGLLRTGRGTPPHSVGLQGRRTAAGFGVRRLVGALLFEFLGYAVSQRQSGKRGARPTIQRRRGRWVGSPGLQFGKRRQTTKRRQAAALQRPAEFILTRWYAQRIIMATNMDVLCIRLRGGCPGTDSGVFCLGIDGARAARPTIWLLQPPRGGATCGLM